MIFEELLGRRRRDIIVEKIIIIQKSVAAEDSYSAPTLCRCFPTVVIRRIFPTIIFRRWNLQRFDAS